MEELKQHIAKNIAALRVCAKLTQAELAEKLNYSDKAVSKWERGESLPDIVVLKQIADMFGVSVDWLLSDNNEKAPQIPAKKDIKKQNHLIITLLSVIGVWFVAILTFVILLICGKALDGGWLAFIAALPISFVLLLVFNCIWGKLKWNQYIISALAWSTLALIYLSLLVASRNYWQIFFIGAPAEVAIIIAHHIKRTKKN